jgi:pyruvate dehydrogenase E2 component (dihydrolipoamide acetyltransferase)
MTRFTVPLLDANLVDVTVTGWRRSPGDRVEKGELLAEVTTDKAVFDLECPCDGVLLEIFAPPRSIVPVGYILALIGEPGEVDPSIPDINRELVRKAADESGATAPAPSSRNGGSPAGPPPAPAPAAVRATPKARRLAKEQGIDLAAVAAAMGASIVTEAILADYRSKRTSPPA